MGKELKALLNGASAEPAPVPLPAPES
jgi:hypothetical protein